MSQKNGEKELLSVSSLVQELDNVEVKTELLLPCLPDIPLLKLFTYLDLSDKINLAMTCVKLYQLSVPALRKCEFDLVGCIKRKTLEEKKQEHDVIKRNLPKIGHCIRVLTIYVKDIDEAVMETCVNVESMRLFADEQEEKKSFEKKRKLILTPAEKIKVIVAGKRKQWIKQLKLKSLWIFDSESTLDVCDDVVDLKELLIDERIPPPIFLEKNLTVERLSIHVDKEFDFRIFRHLQNLQCLHIVFRHDTFDKIFEFVKLDGLTEFSLHLAVGFGITELNSFLHNLAMMTNLDKLRIFCPFLNPDAETFSALKLFNLIALVPRFGYGWDDYTQLIQEIPSPQRLKHLKLALCSKASFEMLVEQWTNVETICIRHYNSNNWDEAFLNDILKSTALRPTLNLNIQMYNAQYMKINFESQQLKKIKNFHGCLNKHEFQFKVDDCNSIFD